MNSEMLSNLKGDIKEMLSVEPRINVTDIKISANLDANEMNVGVAYNIPDIEESDYISISITR